MYRIDHCYFFIIVISTYSEITLGTDYTNIRRTIAITKYFTFEFHFVWLFVVGNFFPFMTIPLHILLCAPICVHQLWRPRGYDVSHVPPKSTVVQTRKYNSYTHSNWTLTHKHQTAAKLPKYTEWFIKLSYYQWVFHRFPKCYIDI